MKRLDGWEPLEETEHVYDADGRLVRSVTRRETEWDPEERGWMMALLLYRSNVHKECGHYLPDSTEVDASYVTDDPVRCHACTARAMAYKRVEAAGNPHPEALLFPVKRR